MRFIDILRLSWGSVADTISFFLLMIMSFYKMEDKSRPPLFPSTAPHGRGKDWRLELEDFYVTEATFFPRTGIWITSKVLFLVEC